ncbi:hypothetical protein C2869_08550 [Saccharobesus litoralis]|uniref:Uroporphyrin-3 C-methyltransferase n=1 Tax=Saccharobesus litoralis TaxID=2172099 RepID=A0A2S0VQJ6_9ALTE|nr:uroporphyrinogen-III C-methyltransferase [Saccharobesus litoralis]AWB66474.1 hypothetical protein C2869_08550 [Saccharobesus litoralis]
MTQEQQKQDTETNNKQSIERVESVDSTDAQGGQSEADDKPSRQASSEATAEQTQAPSVDNAASKTKPAVAVESELRGAAQTVVVKKGGAIAWFALLLALFSIAAIGFLGWQFWLNQQKFDQSQALLEQQQQKQSEWQATQVKNQQAFTQQVERFIEQFQQQAQQQARQNQTQLDALIKEIKAKSASSDEATARADVKQLVSIAGRKIWLAQDLVGAINALEAAQARISKYKNAKWLPLRQALANDIGLIQGLPRPATEDTYLQLVTLANEMASFPIFVVPEPQQPKEDLTLSNSVEHWWPNLLKSARSMTIGFFEVSQRQNIQPLVSPSQEANLRHNLASKMVSAQLALLNNKQSVYSASLLDAAKWLNEYYAQNYPPVQQAISKLNELALMPIVTSFDQVKLSSFIHVESTQPKIIKALAAPKLSQPASPALSQPESMPEAAGTKQGLQDSQESQNENSDNATQASEPQTGVSSEDEKQSDTLEQPTQSSDGGLELQVTPNQPGSTTEDESEAIL